MDDLDRMLYDILSIDNMRKQISDLKKRQEIVETEEEKNIISADIARWEKLLDFCENKKE